MSIIMVVRDYQYDTRNHSKEHWLERTRNTYETYGNLDPLGCLGTSIKLETDLIH